MFSSPRLLNLWMTHIWSSTADDITAHLTVLLPGAVYPPTLYLSSYHTYRNTFLLVLSIYLHAMKSPGAPSSPREGLQTGEKKIPYILEHVNTWDILESKLPLGGYFSWCNLKCSCWDGGIKVQASSLIWFFKLLQRESAVGGAWQSLSFFLRREKPGECLNFDFINWTLTYPKWGKIIHRIHSNIHSERSVIHNSVRRSRFSHHVCVINKLCT